MESGFRRHHFEVVFLSAQNLGWRIGRDLFVCRMSYVVSFDWAQDRFRMSLIVSGKAGTICQNLMPQNLHDTSSQPGLDSLLDFLV
jgi:hypothetical protein